MSLLRLTVDTGEKSSYFVWSFVFGAYDYALAKFNYNNRGARINSITARTEP